MGGRGQLKELFSPAKIAWGILLLGLFLLAINWRQICWIYNLAVGMDRFQHGQLQTAQSLLESAFALTNGFPPKDERRVGTERALAIILMAEGKYAETQEHLEHMLSTDEYIYGKESPEYAQALAIYAGLARRQGQYDLATSRYEQAIAIDSKLAPSEDLASSLNALTKLEVYRGQYKSAKPHAEQALKVTKQLKSNDKSFATVNETLGTVAEAEGHYKTALEHYELALNFAEKTKSSNEIGLALTCLSNLKLSEGDNQVALDFANHAIGLNRTKGSEQLALSNLNAYLNKCVIMTERGDFKTAQACLEDVKNMAIYLGKEHPGHSLYMTCEAQLQAKQGHFKEALQLEQEAINSLEQYFGKNHRFVAHELAQLAELYGKSGDKVKSRELFDSALKTEAVALPAMHPERAFILDRYATFLKNQGELQAAAKLEKEKKEILEFAYSH